MQTLMYGLSAFVALLGTAAIIVGQFRPRTFGGGRGRAALIGLAVFLCGAYGVSRFEPTHIRQGREQREQAAARDAAARNADYAARQAAAAADAAAARQQAETERRAAEERAAAEEAARLEAERAARIAEDKERERVLATLPAVQRMRPPSDRVALDAWREAERHTAPCMVRDPRKQRECEWYTEEFRRDYLRARAGIYLAQRNVAYRLSGPGNPADREHYTGVIADLIQSCAWRLVILSSPHIETGIGDNDNMRTTCGRLTAAGQSDAAVRARQIMRLIAVEPVRNPPPRR
ncbi:hypothetical protein [Falsiroseomonas sp.]|uniref:hypothetical protein n=1 Tax=Falsiroseomonas sp. TaxID=2870721 RepID=UPI003F6E4619